MIIVEKERRDGKLFKRWDNDVWYLFYSLRYLGNGFGSWEPWKNKAREYICNKANSKGK